MGDFTPLVDPAWIRAGACMQRRRARSDGILANNNVLMLTFDFEYLMMYDIELS
jgi:hypothetical protein